MRIASFASAVLAATSVSALPADSNSTHLTRNDRRLVNAQCKRFQVDMDFSGRNIGSVHEPGYDGCWSRCQQNSNCEGFTWTNYQGGTCWLKSSGSFPLYKSGAISGIFMYVPVDVGSPNPPYVVADCDMPGQDAANKPASDYVYCFEKERLFTWSNYNAGTCWCKSGQAPCVYAPGKFSYQHMLQG